MGRRVGAACSPDKVGSSRSRHRRGASVIVRWGGEASRRRASEGVLHVTSHLGSSVEENKYDLIGCDNRRNITKGVRLGQLVLGEPVSHSSTNNLPSIEDLNFFYILSQMLSRRRDGFAHFAPPKMMSDCHMLRMNVRPGMIFLN